MIVLIAIAKDEAENLLEWIAHHKAIGVDHFIILDNESSDGSTEILAALDQNGEITHVPWPTRDRYPGAFWDELIGPQAPGYERALEIARARGRWRWAGFIDLDEFVVPEDEQELEPFLENFAQPGAVGLNWRVYGSSGLKERQPGLLTAQLTMRAPDGWPPNQHVKGFALLDAIRAPGIHFPRLMNGRSIVDTDGCEIDPEMYGLHDRVAFGGAWLNHYYVKNEIDFAKKVRRGRVSKHDSSPEKERDSGSYELHDRNEVWDDTIARFRERTLTEVRRLNAVLASASVNGHGDVLLSASPVSAPPGASPPRRERKVVPNDFDPVAYLEANPDVAAAGVSARAHYLMHGHREGRRIRSS